MFELWYIFQHCSYAVNKVGKTWENTSAHHTQLYIVESAGCHKLIYATMPSSNICLSRCVATMLRH